MGEALDSQSKQTKTEPEGESGELSECPVKCPERWSSLGQADRQVFVECPGAGVRTLSLQIPKVGISKLPGTGTDGGCFKMEALKS